MMTVGSRELKTRLGGYLLKVSQGASFVVTDHGRPVAELRPITEPNGLEERLQALIASGRVTWQRREHLLPATPIRVPGLRLSEALDEEREDRI
jgi:prevent-host-death family protein